ncbi:hypothetical protein [Pseudomonas fluorescens]|uniref:Transmembrane protein n=1 Tax=Pseudomonas fluorescens TaxID=294 RepID=A0A944DHE8_PSEFL|nr:hypothetical protein [Pseudomonas fluorescens]MBT2311828.1 hypothetical protein [Pseudomonas fluorescens]MBT2316779.1 hypothetical protein [Pseudomonas fluorescens]MBT2329792.1 hypothetical protein [Pseudomonas fluorescens]MBT2344598.1 hypothetical protein [Pseudomonas fluorescens]MBT2348012.1 hypothetical protein [Pseudomonas fluorescens]
MGKESRSEQRRMLAWLGGLFVVLAIFFFVINLERAIPCSIKSEIYKWLNIALGISWDNEQGVNTLWLSISLSLRTLLTAGPAIGIVWIVIQILAERGSAMKLADAFANRDAEIKLLLKNNLLKFISPEKKEEYLKSIDEELRQVFNIPDEEFKESLEIIYGKEKSRKILDHLKADI